MKTILFYSILLAMMPAGMAIDITVHNVHAGGWEGQITAAGLTMILGGPLLALLAYTSHGHRLPLRLLAAATVITLLVLWTKAGDRYDDSLVAAAALAAIAPGAIAFIRELWRNRGYIEPPTPTFGEMILKEALTTEEQETAALSYEEALKAAPGLERATATAAWQWQPDTPGKRASDMARKAARELSEEDRNSLRKAAKGKAATLPQKQTA